MNDSLYKYLCARVKSLKSLVSTLEKSLYCLDFGSAEYKDMELRLQITKARIDEVNFLIICASEINGQEI